MTNLCGRIPNIYAALPLQRQQSIIAALECDLHKWLLLKEFKMWRKKKELYI